jgi:hypothetical protein
MRNLPFVLFLAAAASLSAQVSTQGSGRKQVECIYAREFARLVADGVQSCGTEAYAYVLVGTVESLVDISETEKRLRIIPEEVFRGSNVGEVTATMPHSCVLGNQPEIHPGDTWLFYLTGPMYTRVNGNATEVTLLENSPSKPISDAHDDIEALRRLARLANAGILAGYVERLGQTFDDSPVPVPNHKVVAKSRSDGSEYVAFTNISGRFDFELAPGSYDLTANTQDGLRETGDRLSRESVSARGCLRVKIPMLADGKLAGRVTRADGNPAAFIKVAIVPTAPVHPQFTVDTDADGRFDVSGRQPGEYLVGIGLLAPYDSNEWNSRVYYPGVRAREEANVITLGDGEWRTDIDFELPLVAHTK